MSIEEGLASTDVAKIRAARGAAKGQVTKNVRNLKDELVVENDEFLFDQIDEDMVQGVYQKLDTAYNQFQDLHQKILTLRSKETDASAEEEALQKEDNYLENIRRDFIAVKRSYVKYKKALAVSVEKEEKKAEDSTREMKIALLVDIVEDEKKELDSKLKAAREIVDSQDEYVRSTAKPMKDELLEALANYKSKVKELKAALKVVKDDAAEEKYDTALDFDEIEKLKTELSAVIKKTDAATEVPKTEKSSPESDHVDRPNKSKL